MADYFCTQMSDGFGEGFCDFSFWSQKPGSSGKLTEDFEKITDRAPPGTPVYFVRSADGYGAEEDDDEAMGAAGS